MIAAVHQASETVTRIATTDHDKIRAAAQAGRLLVPTRSLPDRFDIPHPFAPAPQDRVDSLLTAYHQAGTRSAQAAEAVAAIAADIRAPSHILTLTRPATQGDSKLTRSSALSVQPVAEVDHEPDFPGPVERILHDLGVTSPAPLERATAIDQLGERLILDAAHAIDPMQAGLEATGLSRSSGAAELINHLLASGGQLATAVLRPTSPRAGRFTQETPHPAAGDLPYTGHQNAWQTPEVEAEP